ncbi:MAG: hypothetical protein JWM83_1535 [Candidatus Angelobacter sp.]|nr:hypothetical protein [Candidatus Angelobacter sp.]
MTNVDDLIKARKLAEEAVSEMQDAQLKLKAFEVILGSLLNRAPAPVDKEQKREVSGAIVRDGTRRDASGPSPSSIAGRVMSLSDEDFFFEQRSLGEIQRKLAERGWHYSQEVLSTPLKRMVQQKLLRRAQVLEGGKRIWKYSNL